MVAHPTTDQLVVHCRAGLLIVGVGLLIVKARRFAARGAARGVRPGGRSPRSRHHFSDEPDLQSRPGSPDGRAALCSGTRTVGQVDQVAVLPASVAGLEALAFVVEAVSPLVSAEETQ